MDYRFTHLTQARVIEPIEASNLTRVDIAAPLGHHPNAALRVRGLERVNVVDERGLGRDLEVANDGVTLGGKWNKKFIIKTPR